MTVYNSPKMTAGVVPKYLPSAGGVNLLAVQSQTTALAANDTINMLQIAGVPADNAAGGPTVIGVVFDCDQLDSGNTLTLSVGDSTVAARYFSVSTIGQGGGYAVPVKSAILGYQPFSGAFYTTYTTVSYQTYVVVVKCITTPNTWVNGNIRLLFEYTYDA